MGIGDWGLGIGIGDWGWGLGIGPNPQSPIPQSQISNLIIQLQEIMLSHILNYSY